MAPNLRIQTDDDNRDSVLVEKNDSITRRAEEIKLRAEKRTQRLKDSLEKIKESIDKKIEKLNDSNTMNDKTIQTRDYGFMIYI